MFQSDKFYNKYRMVRRILNMLAYTVLKYDDRSAYLAGKIRIEFYSVRTVVGIRAVQKYKKSEIQKHFNVRLPILCVFYIFSML